MRLQVDCTCILRVLKFLKVSKISLCFASNFTWSWLKKKKKKKKMLSTSNKELYKGRRTRDFITVLTWVRVSYRVLLHQDAAAILGNIPIKDTL